MRAFEIKKGHQSDSIKKKGMGLEAAGRYKGILTKKDNLFFLEVKR